VNKLGNSPAKDITMKSNLTYINLDNCINKIFQDQGLDDNDNIFIVKYDLLNKKKNNLKIIITIIIMMVIMEMATQIIMIIIQIKIQMTPIIIKI
jgi:hypothetical protein